jgi:hypothetical protein
VTDESPGLTLKATLPQEPDPDVAKDGFPIDHALQRRARHVAVGYALLAAYYVAVAPIVLRYVRWDSLNHLIQDIWARGQILAIMLAYITANLLLAACAWRVITMYRWASRAVVAVAAIHTVWMCGSLGLTLWRALAGWTGLSSLPHVSISLLLLGGYAVCFGVLWRVVSAFNAQRQRALDDAEGRVGP